MELALVGSRNSLREVVWQIGLGDRPRGGFVEQTDRTFGSDMRISYTSWRAHAR